MLSPVSVAITLLMKHPPARWTSLDQHSRKHHTPSHQVMQSQSSIPFSSKAVRLQLTHMPGPTMRACGDSPVFHVSRAKHEAILSPNVGLASVERPCMSRETEKPELGLRNRKTKQRDGLGAFEKSLKPRVCEEGLTCKTVLSWV